MKNAHPARPALVAAGLAVLATSTLATSALSDETEAMSGGETTVVIPRQQLTDRSSFSFPASNLSLVRQGDHFAGNSFFQNAWVTAPASTAARDGLGPLFNTMSCQSCHIKDGRGKTPDAGKPMLSVLVRMSVPAAADGSDDEHVRRHGVVPHPVYGDQIQPRAVVGVAPEAIPTIEWTEEKGAYPDGTRYSLRRPRVVLGDLAYGELGEDAQMSTRVAPALVGIGLLDTIAKEDLLRHADPDDEDGDGISGRPNTVWDIAADAPAIGRFGWKGEQPSVRQQVAAAFAGDIGITSSLFQADSLSPAQRASIDAPNGGVPEVSDKILDLVTFYSKTLAVPARRGHDDAFVREGEQLFHEAGCASCHVPRFVTGDDPAFPELSGQTIYPYTDMLLHDMGEDLADGRPVFDATETEWRTPPLWGIGLVFNVNRHTELLHDGRARNAEEAILWHGGEAEASRDAFKALSKEERRKLLAFLKSL